MTLLSTDILFFLSNPNAGTGFSGTGTPGNSLGRYMSTTQVNPVVPLDDLFTDITSTQNAAQQVDYQCVFIMNNTSSSLTARTPYVWFPQALWTPGGAAMAVAKDNVGAVPYNQASAQAAVIGNSVTQPSGTGAFSPGPHTLFQSGVLLPSIPPLYCVAVWIQRSALGTPPLTPQTLGLTVTFESDA